VLFFGTLIATGGTFFFKVNVDAQLQAEREKLVAQRQAFNQADIERVKLFDKQLKAARDVLESHVTVLDILSALEGKTVATVWYNGFKLARFGDKIDIELMAETDTLNSVLFQRNAFQDSELLADATIHGIKAKKPNTNSDNETQLQLSTNDALAVSFTLSNTFDPSSIQYQPRVFVADGEASQTDDQSNQTTVEAGGGETNVDQVDNVFDNSNQ